MCGKLGNNLFSVTSQSCIILGGSFNPKPPHPLLRGKPWQIGLNDLTVSRPVIGQLTSLTASNWLILSIRSRLPVYSLGRVWINIQKVIIICQEAEYWLVQRRGQEQSRRKQLIGE